MRPTRASRTTWLYFLPVLFFVLGFVLLQISYVGPNVPGGTPLEVFLWVSALVLFGLGILGGILSIGLYIRQARAAKTPQQRITVPERDR